MGNARAFFRFAISLAMRFFAPIAICVLAVPLLLAGQAPTPRETALLLHETQHVSGVVSDSSGRPISGASIQHLGRTILDGTTDSTGHFEFSTQVPAFVIRKNDYESAFVRTENAHSIQITLKQSEARIPACSSKNVCTSVSGWGTVFCFPSIKGVTVSEQTNDIDYGNRIYSVKSEHGRQGMRHGGGPMWGGGLPFDEDVWSSVEYSEKTYQYGTGVITDAKGKSASGKYWRSIGRFGESATYHAADKESAALLDRVIDGMCVRDEKRK
jgi:hypothetical protein